MDQFFKTSLIPYDGVTVATTKKLNNLVPKEDPSTHNEVSASWATHRSAIKLENAKAEPHSVFAIAREHKDDDDDDDDANGDDADGSGANCRAPTKLDKQVATITPWVSSSAFKPTLLELITRGLHERDVMFKTNPIYGGLSLLEQKPTAPLLVLTENSARRERNAFTATICTEKKNGKPGNEQAELNANKYRFKLKESSIKVVCLQSERKHTQ
jgi:hypothetical protein